MYISFSDWCVENEFVGSFLQSTLERMAVLGWGERRWKVIDRLMHTLKIELAGIGECGM